MACLGGNYVPWVFVLPDCTAKQASICEPVLNTSCQKATSCELVLTTVPGNVSVDVITFTLDFACRYVAIAGWAHWSSTNMMDCFETKKFVLISAHDVPLTSKSQITVLP